MTRVFLLDILLFLRALLDAKAKVGSIGRKLLMKVATCPRDHLTRTSRKDGKLIQHTERGSSSAKTQD